jgi:hypothetical protein
MSQIDFEEENEGNKKLKKYRKIKKKRINDKGEEEEYSVQETISEDNSIYE